MMHNLGPLTTTFTQPPSCTVAVKQCLYCTTAWQAQVCLDDSDTPQKDDLDCWPPRAATIPTAEPSPSALGWGYYSPGLYCPEGYSSACSATGGTKPTEFAFQFAPTASETAVGCCPTGYTCTHLTTSNSAYQTCLSVYTTGSFPAAQCSGGMSNGFSYQDIPTTTLGTATAAGGIVFQGTTTLSSWEVLAPMVQINHMSADLFPSTTVSSSSSTGGTKGFVTDGVDGVSPIGNGGGDDKGGGGGGLSGEAKVGIGVGVVLGVLALASLVGWMWYRGKKTTREVDIGKIEGEVKAGKRDMSMPRELHGYTRPPELPSDHMIAEMAAEGRTELHLLSENQIRRFQ